MDLVRLWLHEASRVYGDKLIEEKDVTNMQKMKFDSAKSHFEVSILSSTFDYKSFREFIYRSSYFSGTRPVTIYDVGGASLVSCL